MAYPSRFDRWWLKYARKHDLLTHAAGEKMMRMARAAWRKGREVEAKVKKNNRMMA